LHLKPLQQVVKQLIKYYTDARGGDQEAIVSPTSILMFYYHRRIRFAQLARRSENGLESKGAA